MLCYYGILSKYLFWLGEAFHALSCCMRLNYFLVEKKTHFSLVSSIDLYLGPCSTSMIARPHRMGYSRLFSDIVYWRILDILFQTYTYVQRWRTDVGERI